jgi:hypothetical protein
MKCELKEEKATRGFRHDLHVYHLQPNTKVESRCGCAEATNYRKLGVTPCGVVLRPFLTTWSVPAIGMIGSEGVLVR